MSERDPQSPESESGSASESARSEGTPEASSQVRASGQAEGPVPRLPRGRGLRLSGPEIVRILMFIGMLVGVLALRQPCADGMASFVGQFSPDAGVQAESPEPQSSEPQSPEPQFMAPASSGGQADKEYIRITGEMSEQEIMEKLGQAGVAMPDAGPEAAAEPADDEAGDAPDGAKPDE